MPTVEELRRQLAQENDRAAELTRHVAAQQQERALAGNRAASLRDVYNTASVSAKAELEAVFRVFAGGSDGVSAADVVRVAAESFGVTVAEPRLRESMAGFASGNTPQMHVADFARWWTLCADPPLVSIRSAFAIQAAKKDVALRREKASGSVLGDAPSWHPTVDLRLQTTVGTVSEMFDPKTRISVVATAADEFSFDDAVEDALDATPGGEDDHDVREIVTKKEPSIEAVASIVLPIVNHAATQAELDECMELFRAVTEEFNAQDEVPVVSRIGLRTTKAGSERAFVVALFARAPPAKKRRGKKRGDEPTPFAMFEMLQHLSDLLQIDAECPDPLQTPLPPLFEHLRFSLESDTDAATVLSGGHAAAPVRDLIARMRMVVDAKVPTSTLNLPLLVDSIESDSITRVKDAARATASRTLMGLVNGVDVKAQFEDSVEALELCLDAFVEMQLRQAALSKDEAKRQRIEEEAETLRGALQKGFGKAVSPDVRAADVLGPRQLAMMLGKPAPHSVVSVAGANNAARVNVIRALAGSTRRDSLPNTIEDGVPVLLRPASKDEAALIAMAFNRRQGARAASGPSDRVLYVVDIRSTQSMVQDVKLLKELDVAAFDLCPKLDVLVVNTEGNPATEDELGSVKRAVADALDDPSVAVLAVGGSAQPQWEPTSTIAALPKINTEKDDEDDDDDDDEAEGPAQMVRPIVYAFRKQILGASELTIATRVFTAEIRLDNLNVLAVLPSDEASMAETRAMASASLKSQLKSAEGELGNVDMLRQQSSDYGMAQALAKKKNREVEDSSCCTSSNGISTASDRGGGGDDSSTSIDSDSS